MDIIHSCGLEFQSPAGRSVPLKIDSYRLQRPPDNSAPGSAGPAPKQQVNARSTVEAANLSHFAIPSEAAIALFERNSQRRSPSRTICSAVPREIGWLKAHHRSRLFVHGSSRRRIEFKRIDKRSVMMGKLN
ncbi:hypothetical protein [Bradyrhizobium sp. McL0615]|uniref:hypothetical protein n=1 Tax=Bradyrhizobium sp. McL0615 TaxID=3415673 RepID=UPI003CF8769D